MRSGETYSISYRIPVQLDPSGLPICPCCEMVMVTEDNEHWQCPTMAGVMRTVADRLGETLGNGGIYPDPA